MPTPQLGPVGTFPGITSTTSPGPGAWLTTGPPPPAAWTPTLRSIPGRRPEDVTPATMHNSSPEPPLAQPMPKGEPEAHAKPPPPGPWSLYKQAAGRPPDPRPASQEQRPAVFPVVYGPNGIRAAKGVCPTCGGEGPPEWWDQYNMFGCRQCWGWWPAENIVAPQPAPTPVPNASSPPVKPDPWQEHDDPWLEGANALGPSGIPSSGRPESRGGTRLEEEHSEERAHGGRTLPLSPRPGATRCRRG